MNNSLLIALCLLVFAVNTDAQNTKKATQRFTIFQDDNKGALFSMQVPSESSVNKEFNFVTYVNGKTSLSISYELDDEPKVDFDSKKNNNAELLSYAKALSNEEIGGADAKIANKKVAAKTETINGIPTVLVQYDYTRKGVQKGQEKGKVFLYLVPAKGKSITNENDHPIVVRLQFDFKQAAGVAPDYNLQKEIINTLKER